MDLSNGCATPFVCALRTNDVHTHWQGFPSHICLAERSLCGISSINTKITIRSAQVSWLGFSSAAKWGRNNPSAHVVGRCTGSKTHKKTQQGGVGGKTLQVRHACGGTIKHRSILWE